MKNNGFPRRLRLLKPGDFRYVFENSRYKAFCPGFLLLAAPGQQMETRIGFVIGKKHVKLAVNRNRYKRMFRESFRLQQHQLPAVDIIVLAIKGADQKPADTFHQQLEQAWPQLRRRIAKATANPSPLD